VGQEGQQSASSAATETCPQHPVMHAGRSNVLLGLMRGEVVGVASFAASADLVKLRSTFDIDKMLPPSDYPADARGLLEVCVINPVFEPHAAAWLSAVLREAGLKAAHYALAPGAAPPPAVAACMALAAPRRRRRQQKRVPAAAAMNFALLSFTKSLSSKTPVHSRVGS